MQSNGWRSRVLPLASLRDAPPEFFYLGRPGSAPHEEEAARLAFAAATPALAGLDRVGPSGEARSYCCIAGEKLEEPASFPLASLWRPLRPLPPRGPFLGAGGFWVWAGGRRTDRLLQTSKRISLLLLSARPPPLLRVGPFLSSVDNDSKPLA